MGRPSPHVVVVGGGLAGISAAIAIREAGARVTLVEARPRLGGATASFARDGLVVDTGQHVFLKCCVAYQGLLARLGVSGQVSVQDRFDVTVLAPGGRRARLRRTALPGPLSLAPALARYEFLTPAQRLRAGRAALAMAALRGSGPSASGWRLGDFLARHGQDEDTRRLLWDLFTVSALNVAGDEADLTLAATVVKTALLGAKDAADIGVAAAPLGDLHGRAAASLLTRSGARVLVSAKAAEVAPAPGGGFRVRLRDGGRLLEPGGSGALAGHPAFGGESLLAEDAAAGDGGSPGQTLRADGVVLAVPPEAAARLAPAGVAAAGPGPDQWRQLGASPIVNVHVVYDRRVTRLPFAAAVGSPVQWVFDRTGPAGLRAGQYLAVSLSAADSYVDTPAGQLRERFLPALTELFPAAREARVTDFFVTRERRATMRQTPGCGRLRPPSATAVPGLALAGAWTDTGWPDTMEGAVRSGLNAARELRRSLPQALPGATAPEGAGHAPEGAGHAPDGTGNVPDGTRGVAAGRGETA